MHKHIELGFLLVPDYISILNVLLRSIPSLISPQNHTIIMLHGDHIMTIVKWRPYLWEIPLWFMNIWDVIATIRLVFNASNFLGRVIITFKIEMKTFLPWQPLKKARNTVSRSIFLSNDWTVCIGNENIWKKSKKVFNKFDRYSD